MPFSLAAALGAGPPAAGRDVKRPPAPPARSDPLRTLFFVLFLAGHIILALGALLLRVVGLAVAQLLLLLQRAVSRLDRRRTPPGYPSDADSFVSADEEDPSYNRSQRYRAASALDQDANLQRFLRRGPPNPTHVHHHHIHHRPDQRAWARETCSRLFSGDDAGDVANEHAVDAGSEDESLASSDATGRASTSASQDPSAGGSTLCNLAHELHQMAMRAQAELDARLARCRARSETGMVEVITEMDEPHDGCPGSGGEDTSSSGPCLAAISSTDPSTLLVSHPLTVPLRPTKSGEANPPRSFQPDDLDMITPPARPLPLPLVRSTTAQRRASAPDPILISPWRSDLYGGGVSPSEPDAMARRESCASSQGSSMGRRIRLTEPDWQPFVESHARARARVQLNALLNSARDLHSQRAEPRSSRPSLSIRSSLEDSLSTSRLTPNSRSDIRLHALSAHALHAQAHAQMHARSHARAHSGTTDDEPKSPSSIATRRDSSHASGTASTDEMCFSLTDSALSTSSAVDEPDYWFERFFPGRAAAGSEWDWRRPTPHRRRQERRAAQEAARRAGAACRSPGSSFTSAPDERMSLPDDDRDDTPILDQVAQLLMDPSDDDRLSCSPYPSSRPSVSRIVSQANAAAVVVASSAQVTAARTAHGKASPTPPAEGRSTVMSDRRSLPPRMPQRYTGTRHSRVLPGSRRRMANADDTPPDTSRTASFSRRKQSAESSPAICAS